MGSIGGLLGLSGGAGGSGFSGPQGADIQTPVTTGQATQAQGDSRTALAQQQNLLALLKKQNGVNNQSDVYNQLQGIINGTGANPAQAMLNNATGQNVANQAALMAGQRGASNNVGMIARQAAQQGANTQQQAVGQSAALQAQQSQNALNSAGALANTQVANQIGQTNSAVQARQAQQANLLNGIASQNNAAVGSQSNMNSVNGQLANTTMQGQQALIGGLMNASGGAMALAEGGEIPAQEDIPQQQMVPMAEAASTMMPVPEAMSMPDVNSPSFAAQVQANNATPVITPVYSSSNPGADALKEGISSMGKPKMADGGEVKGAKSRFGQFMSTVGKSLAPTSNDQASGGNAGPKAIADGMANLGKGLNSYMNKPAAEQQGGGSSGGKAVMSAMMAHGGPVPAMLSPGEKYLSPKDVKKVEKGASPVEVGKTVPGKAKVKGNDYANDTVPATLQEGGIVLPKSVMESKHPHWEAHKFVSAIMAKKGKSLPKKG